MLVPWHQPGHWTYGALLLAEGEVAYHDSLGGGHGPCETTAGAQLRDMAVALCDRMAMPVSGWQVRWGSAAHQGRTRDCGVHVLMGIRRWALQGRSPAWRLNGVDARMHIVTELVRGSLAGGLEPRGKCEQQPRPGRRERRRGASRRARKERERTDGGPLPMRRRTEGGLLRPTLQQPGLAGGAQQRATRQLRRQTALHEPSARSVGRRQHQRRTVPGSAAVNQDTKIQLFQFPTPEEKTNSSTNPASPG